MPLTVESLNVNYATVLYCIFSFFIAAAVFYYFEKSKPRKKRGLTRRLTAIGSTTLITETETNLSIAVAIMTLDGPLTTKTFIDHLNNIIKLYPVLYQRYRSIVTNGCFVEMENFDASMNIESVSLKGTRTPLELAEELANTPLQRDLPLWKCHFIEDYKGKAYTIWRIHHCIGDGMSLAMMFAKLTDNFDEVVKKIPPVTKSKPTTHSTKKQKVGIMFFLTALANYLQKLIHVSRSNPSTIFNRKGGKQKFLRISEELKVSQVKAVGRHFGATINDVMLSCITGASRSMLLRYDKESMFSGLNLNGAIPVDMRPLNEEIETSGNKFSSFVVALPVSIDSPVERIKQVVKNLKEVKESPEKYITYMLSRLLALLPKFLTQSLVKSMTKKCSFGISNVRGHPVGLRVCGKGVEGLVGFVPPPPGVNVGICIASCADDLTVSLLADKIIIRHPDEFLHDIIDEFHKLEKAIQLK